MAATNAIQADKMKFRTEMVNGKPQIFFDAIDNSSNRTRTKRTSRASNHAPLRRVPEQEKSKASSRAYPMQNEANPRAINNVHGSEDGSTLGVYMTMDELSELVKAVKENANNHHGAVVEAKVEVPPTYYHETRPELPVPRLDLPVQSQAMPTGEISPRQQALGTIAEKKRQKWTREKAEIERMQLEVEYDQLKHQLSPGHKKSESPERFTFQNDHLSVNNPTVPPAAQQSSRQHDIPRQISEDLSNDALKTRLMEKKQQQWNQENAGKTPLWNPFGRPGAGAPNSTESQARPPASNNSLAYRPPVPPAPRKSDASTISSSPSLTHVDQNHIPAAMRTNLLFGDVRYDDDVKTAKEIERRQWLDDLHKQIEENKRKKFTQDETDRRYDFLNDKVQPIVQDAFHRHHDAKDTTHHHRHDTTAQQALEAGHQTTGEKLFGPTYETPKSTGNGKIDAPYSHAATDQQQAYRSNPARRDEAVNTVDSTFRSDRSIQTDHRTAAVHKQPYANGHGNAALPPHARPHRHGSNPAGGKGARIRSLDDDHPSKANRDDSSSQGKSRGPVDIQHRPLWNYKNAASRLYIPNSKRDPNYEQRQRLKHFEQGNLDYIDDVQKKTCYNRWNSDSELQQQQQRKSQPGTRGRSTVSKPSTDGHGKGESILNLLRGKDKHSDTYGNTKPPSYPMRAGEEYNSNSASSLDRYENYQPYPRADEALDPIRDYSPIPQTRDPSPPKPLTHTANGNEYTYQPVWNETQREVPSIPATSRQEHILQQLSAIKQNLVRRQRELATPMNTIPV